MTGTTPDTDDRRAASTAARLLRRESHRSRSGPAIVVFVIAALAAAWFGTESVLAALGLGALLVAPGDAIRAVGELGDVVPSILIAASAVIAILAVVLVVLALAPGRRKRHTIADDRLSVVVDDGVIASALARVAGSAARTATGQTSASVSRRRSIVEVTPSSGVSVQVPAVEAATEAELDRIAPQPRPSSTVRLAQSGRV